MPIDVTVTEQCDRCKRKEQITIPSDKIAEFEARAEAQAAERARVEQFVEENKGQMPDLVVIFKGEVQTLSNVCDAYCAKTVKNGLEIMFREPKQRKPRQEKTPEEKAAAKAAKEAKANAGNGTKPADKPAKGKGKGAAAPAG
jgi:hypothetical protein